MITNNTVLVLGAGASVDFSFPTGKGLLFSVTDGLARPESEIFQLLQELGYDLPPIKRFHNALTKSPHSSVDAFLERWPDSVRLGKLAIAAALIPHEDENRFRLQRNHVRWYDFLWQRMTDGAGRNIAQNKLAFVTFNYDRSLEHYLFCGLRHGNGLSSEEAADELRQIPIIHLHGQLGNLQYLADEGRPYDPRIDRDAVLQAAEGIKIVHEVGEDEDFIRARDLIVKAKVVCFLGFGYLEANIQRLNLGTKLRSKDTMWRGSAYGLGDGEKEAKKRLLTQHLRFAGRDDDCLETLKAFNVLT